MPKTTNEKIAAVKARKDALAALLAALEAKARTEDRKLDTRRKIVVGGAILAAIESDPVFAGQVRSVLARMVGRANDKAVIQDLLAKPKVNFPVSPTQEKAGESSPPALP